MKKENINWGAVVVDLFIIFVAWKSSVWILIWLVFFTGGYKLNKNYD